LRLPCVSSLTQASRTTAVPVESTLLRSGIPCRLLPKDPRTLVLKPDTDAGADFSLLSHGNRSANVITARDPTFHHTAVLRSRPGCRKRRPLCQNKAVIAFGSRADIPTPPPKVRAPAYRPGHRPCAALSASTPKRRGLGRRTPRRRPGFSPYVHGKHRKRCSQHNS
jgi:hypothetical protein